MIPNRVSLLAVLACAIVAGGCGGSDSSSAKPDDIPPRGEDEMKKQMEILQQKGTLSRVPGVPKDLVKKKN